MQSIKQLCAVAAVEIPFAEAPNVVRALGHILCASRWGEDCSCSGGQLRGVGGVAVIGVKNPCFPISRGWIWGP